jgi:Rrf2 family nitric oxide-sensitive transcriptional repressor
VQLSLFSDYSMRVLLFLAVRRKRGGTIRQIAAHYDISRTHLMKVANELARAGYIQTTRGRAGGLRLARPLEEINVGEVIGRFESRFPLVECFDIKRNACVLSPACVLKTALSNAQTAFFDCLSTYTLADLVRPPAMRRLLQGTPEATVVAET